MTTGLLDELEQATATQVAEQAAAHAALQGEYVNIIRRHATPNAGDAARLRELLPLIGKSAVDVSDDVGGLGRIAELQAQTNQIADIDAKRRAARDAAKDAGAESRRAQQRADALGLEADTLQRRLNYLSRAVTAELRTAKTRYAYLFPNES